jgi:hypothetical protein
MSTDVNKIRENFQLPPQMIPNLSTYVDANQNPLAAFALSQTTSQINAIKQAILRSIFQLTEFQTNSGSAGSAGSSPVDSLVLKFNDLLARVSAYNPGENNAATTSARLSEFRKELSTLDGQKATFVTGGGGFVATAKAAALFYISRILYVLGPTFSIILVTNTFYQLKRVPPDSLLMNATYKLFFAFWAAIWYPVVLLYGIFDPPVYRAFFPLVPDTIPSTRNPLRRLYEYQPPIPNVAQSEWNRSIVRFISGALFVCFLYVYMFYDDMV